MQVHVCMPVSFKNSGISTSNTGTDLENTKEPKAIRTKKIQYIMKWCGKYTFLLKTIFCHWFAIFPPSSQHFYLAPVGYCWSQRHWSRISKSKVEVRKGEEAQRAKISFYLSCPHNNKPKIYQSWIQAAAKILNCVCVVDGCSLHNLKLLGLTEISSVI